MFIARVCLRASSNTTMPAAPQQHQMSPAMTLTDNALPGSAASSCLIHRWRHASSREQAGGVSSHWNVICCFVIFKKHSFDSSLCTGQALIPLPLQTLCQLCCAFVHQRSTDSTRHTRAELVAWCHTPARACETNIWRKPPAIHNMNRFLLHKHKFYCYDFLRHLKWCFLDFFWRGQKCTEDYSLCTYAPKGY